MNKSKIPLEILSLYLPYAVKVSFMHNRKKVIGTVNAVYDDGTIVCHDTVNATPDKFKLVLVSVRKALKEKKVSADAFHYLWNIEACFLKVSSIPYGVVAELLGFHIDIFGLIEQGLAEEKV